LQKDLGFFAVLLVKAIRNSFFMPIYKLGCDDDRSSNANIKTPILDKLCKCLRNMAIIKSFENFL
jgi:hypothetical protein